MKYTYAYKTSDGARHEATMDAESREQVFAALREKGIKAIKVTAADGSKANGEPRGVRKRIVLLAVLVTAAVAGTVAYFVPKTELPAETGELKIARPLPRQTIAGDRKRIEMAQAAFAGKVEAFLARFAEPGRYPIAMRNAQGAIIVPECDWPTKAEFEMSLKTPIQYGEDEFTEQIDLKRMVVGLKREYAAYAQAGGLPSGYIKALIARQQAEIDHREKREAQLKRMISRRTGTDADQKTFQEAYDYWVKANAQLSSMGIYPLELPYALQSFQHSVEF